MQSMLLIGLAWLGADLMTGMIHWWEDRYGNPAWPLLGKWVVQPNIEHHQSPTSFCRKGFLDRNLTSVIPAIILASFFAWLEFYFVSLACLMTAPVSEIHSCAHRRANRVVRFFQRLGIIQSPRHHAIHHRRPYDRYYCVLTDYLNPVLAQIRFWAALELVVFILFRVHPSPEREFD